MLLQVLCLVAVLATLSGTLLSDAVLLVSAVRNDRAANYAEIVADEEEMVYLRHARSLVQQQGTAALENAANGTWNDFGSACGGSTDCGFRYVMQAQVRSGSSSPGRQSANDQATNLQQSFVNEQRASVSLEIAVTDRQGRLAGREMRLLTLRTFNAAPWVTIVGVQGETSHLLDSGNAPGDTGGLVQPTSRGSEVQGDMRVHVALVCTNDGVGGGTNGNEGLPWGHRLNGAVQTSCATAREPLNADAFATPRPWFNGNVNQSEWSR